MEDLVKELLQKHEKDKDLTGPKVGFAFLFEKRLNKSAKS